MSYDKKLKELKAKYADIILNVCDIASEDRDLQLEITQGVLAEIGCEMENVMALVKQKLSSKSNIRYEFKGRVPNEHVLAFYDNNLLKKSSTVSNKYDYIPVIESFIFSNFLISNLIILESNLKLLFSNEYKAIDIAEFTSI